MPDKKITPEHIKIAESNGINYHTLRSRVKKLDWDIEKAITEKPRALKDTGFKKELLDLAAKNGISYKVYYTRVRVDDWDEKKAAITPVPTRKQYSKKLLDLARKNGIHPGTFYSRIQSGMSEMEAATKPLIKRKKIEPLNEYAVYLNDEFLCMGTAQECAEFMDVGIKTFYRYMTDTYKNEQAAVKNSRRRIEVVKLDDDEDEEEESEAI